MDWLHVGDDLGMDPRDRVNVMDRLDSREVIVPLDLRYVPVPPYVAVLLDVLVLVHGLGVV